jgi:hypothetical protein
MARLSHVFSKFSDVTEAASLRIIGSEDHLSGHQQIHSSVFFFCGPGDPRCSRFCVYETEERAGFRGQVSPQAQQKPYHV